MCLCVSVAPIWDFADINYKIYIVATMTIFIVYRHVTYCQM